MLVKRWSPTRGGNLIRQITGWAFCLIAESRNAGPDGSPLSGILTIDM